MAPPYRVNTKPPGSFEPWMFEWQLTQELPITNFCEPVSRP
jgi:hypothetical protein